SDFLSASIPFISIPFLSLPIMSLHLLMSMLLHFSMSMSFMSVPPMPWARLKGIIATDRARTADKTIRRFISFLLSGLMSNCIAQARLHHSAGARPAQQQVRDGYDDHG